MESYKEELYHHGILGQKWGVRRYQNKDGSLTSEGKRRRSNGEASSKTSSKSSTKTRDPEQAKKIARNVAIGVVAAGTVAAAAVYVSKHPEVVSKVGKMVKDSNVKVKDLSKKGIDKGKKYLADKSKEAINSFKEGINEGIKEAPKKAAKAIVIGVAMNSAKRLLDNVVGKEEAARIFQANNNKKIDKFWKVNDDRDKDDEDD